MAQPDKVYRSLSDVKNPEDVYVLKLKWKRLRSIPPEVFTYTNLRELDLSRNNIDSISPDIARLTNLETLNISRNLIASLPEEIGLLAKLQYVDLDRNPLETLPASMAYMPKLQYLILWSTNIRALPEELGALDGKLQLLDMRSCNLTRDEQKAVELLLPSVKKLWDHACNCL